MTPVAPSSAGGSAAPVWMLRINPMARHRLADPDLAATVERLLDLERATTALAAEVSDDLFSLVPGVSGEPRRQLLALRRDIHNDRHRPQAALPADLPPSVGRWAEHQERRLACQKEVQKGLEGALLRERSLLRERVGEGNFLTTLAQSASGVYEDACRYRNRPTVDGKDRKAERALVQFVTRAMVRTSPYGRFTAVGLAQPGPGGPAMDEILPDGATPHVEVDRVIFDYVAAGLTATDTLTTGTPTIDTPAIDTPAIDTPAIDTPTIDALTNDTRVGDPWLMLPPTARIGDDRITFFQVGPNGLRQLSAPLAGHTRLMIDLLAVGPRRRSMLAVAIAEALGVAASEAQRLLRGALQVGLLVTSWRGDEFVAEPVRAAEADVAAGADAHTGADAAHAGLRQVQADLDRLGATSDVGAGVALRARVSATGDELSRLARRPAKLSVHEDFVLDPLVVDPASHRQALDDLAEVTDLLAAFDRMHVVRAVVARALVDRFGPGCQIGLVEHAESLVGTVYRAERRLGQQPDAPVGPTDGSVAMLAKVREAALAALHGTIVDGRGDEVSWPVDDLSDLVGNIPDRFRRDPASYGLVVQPCRGDLIVNDAYAGHGPMVSRFLHADQLRGGQARSRLATRLQLLYGAGAHLLEDEGRYGLSLNAHPRILDESVDAERWQRLQLRHDAETDTVSVVDGGVPVRVLALGAQLPEFLPYPVRLATWLSSSGRVLLDIPAKISRPAGAPATISYPRLRVGRVIVARRRWYLGADFPPRSGSDSDAHYLLALTRWRAVHRVPAEVVLKSAFDGPTMWESLNTAGPRDRFLELRRQSKPQYVDLASAVMTRILPRLIERRPGGYLEEALPSLAPGGHALEWMIDVTRPANGTRFDWREPLGSQP